MSFYISLPSHGFSGICLSVFMPSVSSSVVFLNVCLSVFQMFVVLTLPLLQQRKATDSVHDYLSVCVVVCLQSACLWLFFCEYYSYHSSSCLSDCVPSSTGHKSASFHVYVCLSVYLYISIRFF